MAPAEGICSASTVFLTGATTCFFGEATGFGAAAGLGAALISLPFFCCSAATLLGDTVGLGSFLSTLGSLAPLDALVDAAWAATLLGETVGLGMLMAGRAGSRVSTTSASAAFFTLCGACLTTCNACASPTLLTSRPSIHACSIGSANVFTCSSIMDPTPYTSSPDTSPSMISSESLLTPQNRSSE